MILWFKITRNRPKFDHESAKPNKYPPNPLKAGHAEVRTITKSALGQVNHPNNIKNHKHKEKNTHIDQINIGDMQC